MLLNKCIPLKKKNNIFFSFFFLNLKILDKIKCINCMQCTFIMHAQFQKADRVQGW